MDHPPPPPNISHPGIMAIDITDKFAAAVNKLRPGDLVKDDHFTLFEAVSALEIGDPKMDSGYLVEGEELDEEYDVMRPLLPEEILGIIDQLLCLEMAWHMGYPLSQTLLTSVYIESLMKPNPSCVEEATFTRDPEKLANQDKLLSILRAYCLGLVKACHFVNETVKFELYYEEEDFVSNTYDRTLLCDIPAEPIVDILQQARTDLRTMSSMVPKDIVLALDLRLELRIAFLRAIDLLGLPKANPDSLRLPWIQMKELIEHINRQHALGKPVPEAFSTKLQRRLASTMPPRPIVQPSFDETYQHFVRVFQDGHDMIDVLKYSDPQSLMNFVSTFQARKPQPLVCIRTSMQNLLFKDMVVLGSFSIRQILDHDLSIVVLPCGQQIDTSYDNIELPSDPRHQIANQMELFRQRIAEPYLDIFRLFCQNRCRVRRTMCHSIQEWDLVQADAEEIDQLLQVALDEKPLVTEHGDMGYSLPLSSWAYLYKLRQMEWIVQLGFELTVYQPDELAGMYWYLNYLAKTRAQHGDRIKSFTTRALNTARTSKSSNPPHSSNRDREYMRSLSYIRVTMLDAACTWEFADGLCCLYTVLERVGLLVGPPRPYSADSKRYAIRMKPFTTIALPQLPTFDEFTRATRQPQSSSMDLLRYAETAVGGARKGYEALSRMSDIQAFAVGAHDRWVAGVKSCLRAAISAGLVVTTLMEAITEEENARDRGEKVTGQTTEAATNGETTNSAVVNAEGEPVMAGQNEAIENKKESGDSGNGGGGGDGAGSSLREKYKLEIPEPGKTYHDWWIVPTLVPIQERKSTEEEGGEEEPIHG